MSRKSLILSICVLLVGSGLIPSGLIINNLINQEVANSVDEGLLGIQEEAIPMIEPMIKEQSIPQALRGIRDTGILFVEDMVEATFVTILIKIMALDGGTVLGTYFAPIGVEKFFNNDTTGTWVIFYGISKFHTEALNFSEDAQNRILYGNSTTIPGYIPGIQGLLNDSSTGAGVTLFMNQYLAANSSVTNDLNETMQENYDCTWYQLNKLYEYIVDYLIDQIIPVIIQNNLHVEYMPSLSGLLSVNEIARALFMEQWANGTILGEKLYPDGIDFSEIVDGINETLVGFEVGRVTPSNISRNVAYALFDDLNYPHALTNDTGIEQWIAAFANITIKNNLINEFKLTTTQMDMILNWLFEESFKENIVPELMKLPPPDGVGMNLTEYANVLFLEQWTNGTVNGKTLYPYGFPLELKVATIYGFEIGYQSQTTPIVSTGISLNSARALWNRSNEYSLVNNDGLMKWYQALNNPVSESTSELKEINGLTNEQFTMILSWLPEFRDNVMPFLAQEDRDLPTDSRSLGNSVQVSMIISGGSLIGLACFGLTRDLLIRKKKKRVI